MKIRVLSYNIHSGVGVDGEFSYQRIGKFLASQGADIVCLQEVDLRDPSLDKADVIDDLKANYFEHFIPAPAVKTAAGYYGNAILSRYSPNTTRTVDISVEGQQARNIQQVNFDLKGTALTILNTHFGLQATERQFQFTQLIAHLKQLEPSEKSNALLLGDFNEWRPITRSLRKLSALMTHIPMGATFPNRLAIFKLDKAWRAENIDCLSAHVLKTQETRNFSDHYPISLECRIRDN